MFPKTIHHRMLHAIRSESFIPRGATVVLAVSGGPDSMALLDAMDCLARRRDMRWTLHVAHLNHQIRGRAADRDARFVARQAALRGLPTQIESMNIPRMARSAGQSLEEAARNARYAFLERLALAGGATCVALAHHADDQIETILHNLIRGTGLRGLIGMPATRPIRDDSPVRIVRPFLGIERRSLIEYLAARKVPYCKDATNRDVRHTRNRLRQRLIPMIAREFNPRFGDALLRLSSQSRAALALIDSAASAIWSPSETLAGDARSTQSAGPIRITLKRLRGASPLVMSEVIRRAIAELDHSLGEVGFERLTAALRIIEGPHGGRRIQLPGGVTISRRGGDVVIGRDA